MGNKKQTPQPGQASPSTRSRASWYSPPDLAGGQHARLLPQGIPQSQFHCTGIVDPGSSQLGARLPSVDMFHPVRCD